MTKEIKKASLRTLISMRMPTHLLKWLKKKAERDNTTMTQCIVEIVTTAKVKEELLSR